MTDRLGNETNRTQHGGTLREHQIKTFCNKKHSRNCECSMYHQLLDKQSHDTADKAPKLQQKRQWSSSENENERIRLEELSAYHAHKIRIETLLY